jgi:hypothetical protein
MERSSLVSGPDFAHLALDHPQQARPTRVIREKELHATQDLGFQTGVVQTLLQIQNQARHNKSHLIPN